ncbi:cupin domain-containing protein [Microbacterium gorillae]|uniref:cupin domain-containing protein n=1 Tax=Microbacterium gorillae TaxID=1231063 RepID=UPI00058D1BEA|nr:dimethylsulfonioproprionate lyase family protein [Microbacterium gorillae]
MSAADAAPEAERCGAEIVIRNIADVAEIPIGSVTVAHDQGWTKLLVREDLNGSPDLAVAMFRMGPHQHHPPHRHPNLGELYFIWEGRGRVRVGDRVEWVEAGTAIYIPKGVPHGMDTGDEGVSILIVFPEGDDANIVKEFVEDSDERF